MTEHDENCSFLLYILDHGGKVTQTVTSAHGAFLKKGSGTHAHEFKTKGVEVILVVIDIKLDPSYGV